MIIYEIERKKKWIETTKQSIYVNFRSAMLIIE